MKKGYVCNKYKSFSIRNVIQFQDGLFETEDPELQRLVESNDLYGIAIHPRETADEVAAMEGEAKAESEAEPQEETSGGAVHGMRGTRRTRRQR